jgi:hypothetical protein
VLAAIVGGGLTVLNVELPVLRRPIQYVLLVVVGVGLFISGWYVHVQKPPDPLAGIMATVTSSRAAQDHGYPCAATFTGTIAITEGQGAVNYTWFAFTIEPMNRSLNGDCNRRYAGARTGVWTCLYPCRHARDNAIKAIAFLFHLLNTQPSITGMTVR